MGLYVKSTATFQAASDSNLNDARADWVESYTHATTDTKADRNASGRYTVAASGTQAIAFGPVTTAHSVFIKSDRRVTVKLNGDSTGFAISHTEGSEGYFVLPSTNVTSITVVNNGSATATVDYELVGV